MGQQQDEFGSWPHDAPRQDGRAGEPPVPPALALAWIEEEALDPADHALLERAFEAAPEFRRWAVGARRDRAQLRALAEFEAGRAPRGLHAAAIEMAEREALLGSGDGARRQPSRRTRNAPKRVRITPVRFVMAAALVIVTGVASIIGLLLTTTNPPRTPLGSTPLAQAPVEAVNPDHEDAAQAEGASTEGILASGPPRQTAEIRADQLESRSDSVAATPVPSREEIADSALASPALTFRLIHPGAEAPEHAVSPERAAELAREGRLLLLIRAPQPRVVEQSLLAIGGAAEPERQGRDAHPTDTGLSLHWRSIDGLDFGPAALSSDDDAPATDAARVILVDVYAFPGAMEQLIAIATLKAGVTDGAWLQEIAEPHHLKPVLTLEDVLWWRPSDLPPRLRAVVPVLIERPSSEPTAQPVR